ncbi:MAG: UDP-N-acetylmuramoyl-tripeptide--D-alanyl-D-alanine ligase, partial [Lachnospiraceae bacterium]|nr:UDP-N-acetylmuramoyl-tripeptide--D-alanyl-D-alanine ligase [Lachnospiraceae bacterium]
LIKTDYLFIPIRGARVDGHDFIPKVMSAGALCTLSEKLLEGASYPYILVNSCEQALKDLAEYYRSSLDIKVVGITGSVGKTSTKEMIASVLEQKFNVLKTAGNYNNEIGLPLTIFNLRNEHEIAILEMGISEFGEMTRLAKMARPDVCVITNIGLCHLEFLKSRNGILKAKTEIFDYMQPGGAIILNGDDDMLATIGKTKGTMPCFFGLSTNHNCYATDIQSLGLKGTICTIHFPEETLTVTIPIPGIHMVYNALAGACVGQALHLTPIEIKAGIECLKPVSGRNNIIETSEITVIDDCYNANPVSMKASLDVLSNALGRKIAILGDMGELGDNEKALHYEVGRYATHSGIDIIICIGTLAKEIANGAIDTAGSSGTVSPCILHYNTKELFLEASKSIIQKNDTILIKASHFMNFPVIVEALVK